MSKLQKISDNVFGGNHPNGINKGYVKEIKGRAAVPVIGESYCFGSLITSTVTAIESFNDEEVTFKTRNSTYHVIY